MFNTNNSGSFTRANSSSRSSSHVGRSEKFNGFKDKSHSGFVKSHRGLENNSRSRFSSRSSSGSRSSNMGRSSQGGRNRKSFNDLSKFINKVSATDGVTEKLFVAKNNFTDFNLDERLKQNIRDNNYLMPSEIQDVSIPHILEGKDLVGIANTGTGKTAAFLIPLIDKVLKDKKEMVIILAPTRELAVQIDEEFKKFVKGLRMWSICAVGGMSIFNQIKDFRYEHNFVIGTPGRLKDLIERKVLNIKEFKTIVLDESDRMLDMGFVDDMKILMKAMPRPHQTLFFSATISREVTKIIKEFLIDPIEVSVKTRDTAAGIDQDVVYSNGKNKIDVLHNLLKKPELEKIIIFGKTKSGVDRLHKTLKELGHNVESIHGDRRPRERNQALKSFKENYSKILIATDVAARGLDIPNVSHVINYELPSTYEDYIHRIGRTGRAGKAGKALTFVE